MNTERDDELIQELAFRGLANPIKHSLSAPGAAQPDFTRRSPPTGEGRQPGPETRNALLVHGTIANWRGHPLEEWWKPNIGDLHQYLSQGSMPYLYSGSDHYYWSGGWSDHARADAAKRLIDWLSVRNISAPDIVAHSHGCNVAMLASQHFNMNKLVLLSW